eukprot:83030-Amphidinium_carterae.1
MSHGGAVSTVMPGYGQQPRGYDIYRKVSLALDHCATQDRLLLIVTDAACDKNWAHCSKMPEDGTYAGHATVANGQVIMPEVAR